MKKNRVLLIAAFTALLFAVSAQAAELRVSIPFPFLAGDTVLPQGEYRIAWDGRSPNVITFLDSAGRAQKQLVIMSRLTRSESISVSGPAVVFDKVGSQRTVSEIWLSDRDGFLVGSVAGKHSHELLNG